MPTRLYPDAPRATADPGDATTVDRALHGAAACLLLVGAALLLREGFSAPMAGDPIRGVGVTLVALGAFALFSVYLLFQREYVPGGISGVFLGIAAVIVGPLTAGIPVIVGGVLLLMRADAA